MPKFALNTLLWSQVAVLYCHYMIGDGSKLLVFPDTNVLIQGRALHDLPWRELGRETIDIVICGAVIRELDGLKGKGGRAGRVARAMSTKVRELLALPNKEEELQKCDPRVTRRLLFDLASRKAVRDGLDLTHGDQAIINHALAQMDAGEDVVLLTDDNFAAMMAAEFGLPVRLLPASWRKLPEADEAEKEINRRDVEIAQLKSAEPAPTLRFTDLDGTVIDRLDVRMPRYVAAAEADIERLMQRVARIAPRAELKFELPRDEGPANPRNEIRGLANILASQLPVTPVSQSEIIKYNGDYDTWIARAREKIADFHDEWNRRRQWPRAILLAANRGSRPADDVLVELEASGPFGMSGDDDAQGKKAASGQAWLSISAPPKPPRPRTALDDIYAQINGALGAQAPFPRPHHQLSGLRREADKFYWRQGEHAATTTIALGCKQWRHGRKENDFPFRLWGSDGKDFAGIIVARVSAANLTHPVEIRLPVRVLFEDKSVSPMVETLVDEFEHRLSKASS